MCFAYFSKINILQIVWSHSHPWHSCGSTFTCFEIHEQHIIPKVNTFYAKTLLVIVLCLFCILFRCSCVKPSDMVLVLSFEPVVSASARVGEM